MVKRIHREGEQPPSAEQAAEWLNRLRKGGAEDKRAFLRWLKRSPQNIGETLLATSTDVVLKQFFRDRSIDLNRASAEADNVVPFDAVSPAPPRAPARRRQSWLISTGLGLATAAALMVLLPSVFGEWWRHKTYVTSVGEQRTIELPDGSFVWINAESNVQVGYSETARDVYLKDGQALFSVAKDAQRPFRVHVGKNIVQAVGTKFDVRRRAERTQVAVAEGTVVVRRDSAGSSPKADPALIAGATKVTAGEAVSIVRSGNVTPPQPVKIAEIGLWQQRRLVFVDNTLAEIAEEFSHYNLTPHLRIEGEALRARRLSGVFDADSPEALLIFFAKDDTVEVDRRGDEIIIRPRPIVVQSEAAL